MSKIIKDIINMETAELIVPHGAEFYVVHTVFRDENQKADDVAERAAPVETAPVKRPAVAERMESRRAAPDSCQILGDCTSELRRMIKVNNGQAACSDRDRIRNCEASEFKDVLREAALKKLEEKESD